MEEIIPKPETLKEQGTNLLSDTPPHSQPMSKLYNELLPENVSNAAKTLVDYAVDSLAKKMNQSNCDKQIPEVPFVNMANSFATTKGGKAGKSKNKKTRKNTAKI